MSERASLPIAWIERIWERFALVYGHTRTAPMFDGADLPALKDFWSYELGGFGKETIKAALLALRDRADPWPPTLPEFVQLCRQFNRPEHSVPALMPPRSEPPPDMVEAVRIIGATKGPSDPLFWARYPASRKAVEFLVMGAQYDHRLRAILRQHLADPHHATVREHHPRADEARQALVQLAASPPAYLLAAA